MRMSLTWHSSRRRGSRCLAGVSAGRGWLRRTLSRARRCCLRRGPRPGSTGWPRASRRAASPWPSECRTRGACNRCAHDYRLCSRCFDTYIDCRPYIDCCYTTIYRLLTIETDLNLIFFKNYYQTWREEDRLNITMCFNLIHRGTHHSRKSLKLP